MRRTTEAAYTISCPGAFGSGELKRGNNSVNTGGRVEVLAFCDFPQVYQVSLIYLEYFYRYAPDKSVMDGWTDRQDRRMDKVAAICSPFGEPKEPEHTLSISVINSAIFSFQ